ncbi:MULTISPECIES: pitrilysin family protein [unclassified Janthinobacterium]|uniref:M16 family metallopeptidase n=1 Tax=unclassified Janthinobacterium TaxID=2610881 RepID=UPI0016145EFA|nr:MULTISPECIES: pitrilysin family protein [unclassified Janthinobacterium]MBB5368117.1 zinc protease [Janthinobacterium sp. K2C7]MBB5379405.1 zinc protease [Janthinobacterium sp. K2Li3]MBB5386499.1 zinc protease [Janthinobacterium sp. K2E3]
MKSMKLLAIPALILSLYGAPLSLSYAADAAASATVVPNIAYEKYNLPNGLEVILVQDHKLPVTAVNIWYHVGPANEAPGLTGFAHLFEHMMFAATKHVPRGLADQLLEGAGATDSNGSTDFDRTNYFDTVPSNQLELALWAHSDRMGYLLDVLDQTALTNQQDVVRNERRQSVENRPYGIVEEALYHQLFPKTHPYYASVIGSHADIQNAKLADIREFFTKYYGPNNASLVIAGDIDKAKTKELVNKYFGSFKSGPPVAKPNVVTPPITQERRIVVQDHVELPRVFMAWLTPSAYQPDDAELTIAAQILAGGKSSRLYKSLVYDKQIAQDVNANQSSNALTSVFSVDVTARPGHKPEEIEQAMNAELEQLRTSGPTEKEIERARNGIETGMLGQVEKVGSNANMMNQYNQYTGDPGYLAKDIERYRKVTAAGVQRAVDTYLKNQARVVVYGVPGTPDLGPEVPTPAPGKVKSAPGTAINADEAWRNKVPAAGPAPAIHLPQGKSFTLANGLTVIYNSNPGVPLVSTQLVIKSGSGANPLAQPGLSSFTAQLLQEGTATRTAPQIADEVAQLGAFLGTGSGVDASFAQLTSLKATFPQALDLLADVVQHPQFPQAEVERQRASRIGELAQQRENAGAVAARVEAAALYGPKHPYGNIQLGTEAALKATTRADLQAFWQQHYVPNNAALIVSGDISEAELKALAEAKFGAWEAGTVAPSVHATPETTKARLILVDKPGAPQTAVRLSTIAVDRKTPDYAPLQVMNAALGGLFTSRLSNNLREEKGYTYGVRSQFQYRSQPGPFSIAAGVRTDVTGPAVSETFKEIRAMIAKPLTAKELSNARNSQVLSLPGQFETNASISASMANTYIYGLGLDYYSSLPQRFSSVTGKQVQEVVKKYLQPEKLIVIGVGDKAKIEPQLSKLKLAPVEVRDTEGNVK